MRLLKCSQKATSTVPIVFSVVVEPVGDRLTANLQRSDGNATGVHTMVTDWLATLNLISLKNFILDRRPLSAHFCRSPSSA